MRNLWLIIRREYLVRVRTKSFVIFTLLMPLLLGGVLVVPAKLMTRSSGTKRIVIVTPNATLANTMRSELLGMESSGEEGGEKKATAKSQYEVSIQTTLSEALRQQLTGQVRSGALDGFAWIDSEAEAKRKGLYYSRNATDFIDASQVSRALRFALSEGELDRYGLTREQAKTLLGPVQVDTVRVDKQGENKSNGMGAFLLPFLLLVAIYSTVFIYGLYVMRSVLEEKSSRVIEVLLGSVTPFELMAGKIIGVGAVGLTQIAIWASCGALLGTGSFAMARQLLGDSMQDAHVSTSVFILFPTFFLLGYATYACLYAAVGALVNSDEEAQQLQFPITFPLILCMICATSIIRDPNTPLAFWLSMFPLTSPIIMFVRVSVSDPPIWQLVTSVVLNLLSLGGLVWLTSRIYRVGILMYGKRPTLPEIVRWLRYA